MLRKLLTTGFWLGVMLFSLSSPSKAQPSTQYYIVLSGGRVIDPETQLDAIRNVGILKGRIAEISSQSLSGKEVINVSGFVVAPGFIDMHVHGRSNKEAEYKLHDGVTTMLELEFGIELLDQWYASRKSKALINYGASVCWRLERFRSTGDHQSELDVLSRLTQAGESNIDSMFNAIQPSFTEKLTAEQMSKTIENIKKALAEGGIGIGVPIGYLPAVKPGEVFQIYQLASAMKVPIFSHVRAEGITSVHQAIADAMLTGASLHIVHINSTTLGDIHLALEMVQLARDHGFDISTELYPYTAASTMLQSAVFDTGWQERNGISYGDLQWVATGERLTKESFDQYRRTGGTVIIHSMKPEWIAEGIAAKGTIIASDGMRYAKLAHPRLAGTYSRVLGKYVREDKLIGLSEALEKMTLLPAKRLEGVAPIMKKRAGFRLVPMQTLLYSIRKR
jgi:dihydroorotase